MKTAFLNFGGIAFNDVEKIFSRGGISIDTVQRISPTDDIGFRRGYETFRDTADALIIADGAAFDLKAAVAEFCETSLIENENARKMLEEKGFSDFSGALMPAEATLIPNDTGAYQGFVVEERDFILIVLPGDTEGFFAACKKYILPYFAAKSGIDKTHVFKCFAKKTDVEKLLLPVKEKHGFTFTITEDFGDVTVTVAFRNFVAEEYRAAMRDVAFALKDICYADSDMGLSETLFTLLKLGGRKISVAESFTGGRVVAEIIKNSGASSVVHEGIVCYSDDSKTARTGVSASDVNTIGAVSAQVAYQMAYGLLKTGKCDVAIATTGQIGKSTRLNSSHNA